MDIVDKLKILRANGLKYKFDKINGEYVFVSLRSKNKTIGSNASDEYKRKRKIKNKIQRKSRSINSNNRR